MVKLSGGYLLSDTVSLIICLDVLENPKGDKIYDQPASPVADKRQRDADNRQNSKIHSDIDKGLGNQNNAEPGSKKA